MPTDPKPSPGDIPTLGRAVMAFAESAYGPDVAVSVVIYTSFGKKCILPFGTLPYAWQKKLDRKRRRQR